MHSFITKTARRFGYGLLLLVIAAAFLKGYNPQALAHTQPQAKAAASNVYLPAVFNNHCFSNLPSTPFGVQMFGDTGRNSKYYTDLVASNARFIRVETSWASVEPTNTTPANYNWGEMDAMLGAAFDGCYNMILTHAFNPSWTATNIAGPLDKISLSEFAEYLGALAERYDGDGQNDAPGSPKVYYFELYNEPDGVARPGTPTWGEVGTNYAEMLAAAYPAIKNANPNAKVLIGGIAYDWWRETSGGPFVRGFLDEVLRAGGGNFFDIMNFHIYPAFGPNWSNNGGTGLIEKTQAIRNKMSEFSVNKPIFITEMGWHNNNAPDVPSNDEDQLRYVTQLFVQSLAARVEVSIWWPLFDIGGSYPFDSGLVTNSTPPARKQAFSVFVNLTKELQTASFTRSYSAQETGIDNLELYEFNDPARQRRLFVAWLRPIRTTESKAITITGLTTGAGVTVRDLFGATVAVNSVANGQTTVTAGGRPIFVEIK